MSIPLKDVTGIGEYVGPDPNLFGEPALVFCLQNGRVLAQFDNESLVIDGEFAGDTWHEFDRKDFLLDSDAAEVKAGFVLAGFAAAIVLIILFAGAITGGW